MKEKCPNCGGTGEIEHRCNLKNLTQVKLLSERSSPGSYECWKIEQCPKCLQFYSNVYQFDDGTGHDDKSERISAAEADRLCKEFGR